MVETWHDPDDVGICRLRAGGFHVVDVPRPRAVSDTAATNHGGIAAVAFTDAWLELIDIDATPSMFEFACVRVSSGAVSYIVCAVYRPGSATVSATFFVDLTDVLDRLATSVEPLFVVGDLNVHFERPADASSVQLVDLLTAPTHDLGGLLDIVASGDDLPPPSVEVVDVGLSDHRLVRWSVLTSRPPPDYTTSVVRPWRQLECLMLLPS